MQEYGCVALAGPERVRACVQYVALMLSRPRVRGSSVQVCPCAAMHDHPCASQLLAG